MARARNIKPAFFLNDELAELPVLARLLFIGLWCIADRDGYLEDKPNKIKAEILPYDNCNVDELLEKLNGNFIKRYVVNGKKYIFIMNFKKHQHPHLKEQINEIPRIDKALDENQTSTILAPDKNGANPSLNLKPITENLKPTTENLKPTTENLKPITENLKPTTENLKPTTENLKPTTENLKPTTENLKPTTENFNTIVDDSCVDGLQNANDSCVDDLRDVISFYEHNIGLLTPYGLEIFEDYSKEMSNELLILAMKKAVEANKRTIQYIKGILNNWSKKGIKTILEAKQEDENFRNRNVTPQKETEEERQKRIEQEIKAMEERVAKMNDWN